MTVSVIIPAHNYGRFVAGAVESALEQTVPPREVIVVDDGSTDETPRVLARYHGRIMTQRLAGRGVAEARNVGLREARGDYVLFLDADDLLLPDALAAYQHYLRVHPQTDAVCGAWYQCDLLTGEAVLVRSRAGNGGVLPRLFMGNIVFTPSAMLLRRETVAGAGGFDPALSFAADWELWLRLALRGSSFGAVSEAVTVYRIHAGSMTRALAPASREVWQVLERALADPAAPPAAGVRADAIYQMGLYLARLHLHQGDLEGAAGELRRALAGRPERAESAECYAQLAGAVIRRQRVAGGPAPSWVVRTVRDLAAGLPGGVPRRREAAALLGSGLALRNDGRYGSALRFLASAVWKSPSLVLSRGHLSIGARVLLPRGASGALRRALWGGRSGPLPPLVAAVLAEAREGHPGVQGALAAAREP